MYDIDPPDTIEPCEQCGELALYTEGRCAACGYPAVLWTEAELMAALAEGAVCAVLLLARMADGELPLEPPAPALEPELDDSIPF